MAGPSGKSDEKRAVVLLSGGMDSAVAAAIAAEDGNSLFAISFDYGQRHRIELESAKKLSRSLGAEEHKIVTVDLSQIGGSALTADIDVPHDRDDGEAIPVTYVPARNIVFLSVALGYAEVVGAQNIVIGANAIDYSGYPDCRPEFISAFQQVAETGTKAGVEGHPPRIWAPLVQMSKADIVREGQRLGVDFSLTTSCYDPSAGGRPCGTCDSCILRKRGFSEAGIPDPLYS